MLSKYRFYMRTYLRHLYRDRVRFAVSSFLFLLTALIAPNCLPDPLPVVQSEIVLLTGLFFAMPLVAIFARDKRHMIEVIALATFFFALIGLALPTSAANFTQPSVIYLLGAALYGAMLFFTYTLLYGHWSDQLLRSHLVKRTSRTRTHLDVRSLWYGLVPTPGYIDRNPDPGVVSIEYADAKRESVRVVTWPEGQTPGETLVHLDEIEPFSYVKLRMRVISGKRDRAAEGTTEFRLIDKGDYRIFEASHEMPSLPPRRMLRGWLDDTFGRMMDDRLAAIECRAARAQTHKTRTSLPEWNGEATHTCLASNPLSSTYRTPYGRSLNTSEEAALTGLPANRHASRLSA